MNYTIGLTYGDPSCDGHGMSETDYYKSNYKTKDIKKAVSKTSQDVGIDFEYICAEYGESYLNEDTYSKLATILPVDSYVEEEGYNVHDFTGLYLAFAKVSLPDLETEFIQITTDTIGIGGYGLFEN